VDYSEVCSNEKALGFDVYSNPKRKKAMDKAKDTGLPVATARIFLVQETAKQTGILIFLPIYKDAKVPSSKEERQKILRGYAVGVFRIGDVLTSAFKGLNINYTETFLTDETMASEYSVLAAYHVSGKGTGELLPLNQINLKKNDLSWSTTFDIGGRVWRILVTPTSKYLSNNRSWAAWGILVGGLLFTGLLSVFLLILTGSAIADKQQANHLLNLNTELNNEIEQHEKTEYSLRQAISERKRAEEKLQTAHDELEQRVQDRTIKLTNEVGERKQVEESLKLSLEEKEILLREIHHRVKNNLAVIISLLNLQTHQMQDDRVSEALQDSCDRIKSMALIHETIYKSNNLSRIFLENYTRQLGGRLLHAMKEKSGQIRIFYKIEDIRLEVDQAIPCGLILNELITNALKYAFPHGNGEIRITAHYIAEGCIELVIQDNGVGLPEELNLSNLDSLGLKIVSILSENQLDGTLDIRNEEGACFSIRWPVEVNKGKEKKND